MTPDSRYKLEDLIDIDHFQNLQDRINEIYTFPSSIIDNDGNILTATGWQEVCTDFHRKNPESEKACIQSDRYIRDHINEANPAVTYHCPHGLVDNAAPIIIDGIHYGNFFTGQFFLEEPDLSFFSAQAKKYGFHEERYLEAVKRVPIWSKEQQNNYLFFIKGLITIISESGLKSLKEMESRKKVNLSERRHRAILRSAMDGFYLINPEYRLEEVNEAYCGMSGYSEKELLGMDISELEASMSKSQIYAHVQKVISEGRYRFESRHRRKDGSVYDVEISAQYQSFDGGKIVTFVRDITKRKKYEHALEESEKRFSELFEHMSNGAAVYEPVDGGRDFLFKAFNRAAEKITCISADRALGSSLLQLFPHMGESGLVMALKRVWETGREEHLAPFYYKDDVREGWRENRIFRLPAGEVVALFDDVTERIETQNNLIESRERYRKLITTVPYGIQLTDREGKIIYSNPAHHRIQGYRDGELIGKYIWDLMADDTVRQSAKAYYNKIIAEQPSPEVFYNRDRTKDGREIDIQVNWDYFYDSEGEIEGIISIISDITKQKLLEAKLQHSQKMESIGTLAGGIAHDFNNLLSPIMIHSEMIMNELSPDEPLLHNINEIYKAGERARDLVKQILTIARKRTEEKVILNASSIVKDAVKFLRSTIPTTIDIRYDNRAKMDTILADPAQLNQIVMNLCTNAAHAMKKHGGSLRVVLDNKDLSGGKENEQINLPSGQYLKLIVSDTGTGISPENMNRIFEPYFTTKEPGEGTGLGLATILGIVKSYGGDVTVKSSLTKGSTFSIYIPLKETEALPEAIERKSAPVRGNERILFVDDEESSVKVMVRMFERLGYRIKARKNGRDALEAFKKDPEAFDIVITDMTMPHMTGKELAIEIRALRPDIPMIICTGFSDQIDEKEAKKLGFNAFIFKPIVMSEITKIVREVLDNSSESD